MDEEYNKLKAKKLKEEVRDMFNDLGTEILAKLELIIDFQRLGLGVLAKWNKQGKRRMGRIFVVELEGRPYRCKFCGTHLALPDDIVSRGFHSRRGKAYLFNNAVNITMGPLEERVMLSGMHTVADIFCCCCGQIVGWKYHAAHENAQKYKEGKFVLERNNEALNSVGNASADDLESVLRQRALENLKKFRGGIETNANTPIDEIILSASIPVAKPEICQAKSPEDQGAKVNAGLESVVVGSENALRRDTAHPSQNEENLYRYIGGNESGSAKQDAALVTDSTIEGGQILLLLCVELIKCCS
ncbi:protein yippee-like [Tripterygium wilfordii]|uniref:Protein yippee-like n=1 Tax=Tripterygium wilfordii TaxID=458696 RepID=A0A7J7C965_TRIWF|nr:protein yippee-like [Tripterygium wilfordii]